MKIILKSLAALALVLALAYGAPAMASEYAGMNCWGTFERVNGKGIVQLDFTADGRVVEVYWSASNFGDYTFRQQQSMSDALPRSGYVTHADTLPVEDASGQFEGLLYTVVARSPKTGMTVYLPPLSPSGQVVGIVYGGGRYPASAKFTCRRAAPK